MLQPLIRTQIRSLVGRFVLLSIIGWLPLPVSGLVGMLAVASNSLGLFVLGASSLFIACVVSAIFAVVLSVLWTPRALLVWWSVRDGEVGPWSSGPRHFVAWIGLLMVQLAGAAIAAFLGWSLFPDYPAGWP